MKDLVINGTGNSRNLKSSIPAGTTWEQALAMLQEGTFPIDLNGLNPDGIQQMGSAYSKGNVLPDNILTKMGLSTGSEPKDAFGVLADVGNIHVWKRVVTDTNTTDYPTSTNRNAYPDSPDVGEVPEVPAGYTLGDVASKVLAKSNVSAGTTIRDTITYASSVSVSDNGVVSLDGASTITNVYSGSLDAIKGKFITVSVGSDETTEIMEIVFVPSDATITSTGWVGLNSTVTVSKVQQVTGYPLTPAIPVTTQYTYLGQMGEKPKVQVLSYVGTGTYGASNPCSVTADFPIKVLIYVGYFAVTGSKNYIMKNQIIVPSVFGESWDSGGKGFYYDSSRGLYHKRSGDGRTVYWYQGAAPYQANESGITYYFVAIG